MNQQIYGLVDGATGMLRYVGKTSKPLDLRLKQHLSDKSKTHKVHWIRKLVKSGSTVCIIPIQTVDPEISNAAEIFWIKYFKNLGFSLTNGTDGGDGTTGYVFTEEVRLKLSRAALGKRKTDSHRVNISKALMGRPAPWAKGFRTSEVKNKISRSKTGKKMADWVVEKMRVNGASRGRAVIDDLGNKFTSVGTAAIYYNVDRAAIRRVCQGLKKTSCGRIFRYE